VERIFLCADPLLIRSLSKHWNALYREKVLRECLFTLRLWQNLYCIGPDYYRPDARKGVPLERVQAMLVWEAEQDNWRNFWRNVYFGCHESSNWRAEVMELAKIPMDKEKLRWIGEKRYFLEFVLSKNPQRSSTLISFIDDKALERLEAWADAFGLQSRACVNNKAPLAWKPYCSSCKSFRLELCNGRKRCAVCGNLGYRRYRWDRKNGLLQRQQTFIRITKI